MNGRVGIPLVLVAAALVVWGLGAGAESQHETFLGQNEGEQLEAAGSLVVVTTFLCGAGIGLAAFALGRAPLRQRIPGALQAGVAAWLLTAWLQNDFPNWDAIEALEIATLSQTTLLREGGGSPSVLLAVLAFGYAGCMTVLDGLRRCIAPAQRPDLPALAREHRAAVAAAIPFLAIAAFGSIRVVLSLPDTEPRIALAFVLLPVAAMAAASAAVLLILRVMHVSALAQDPRLVPFTREAWRNLRTGDAVVLGALGLCAVLSTALTTTDTDATAVGRTLVLTLRSHGQGLVFVMVPLVHVLLLHRRIAHRLDALEPDADPWVLPNAWGFTGAAIASTLLAGVGTLLGASLLPWILAFLPLAVYAGVRLPAMASVPVMFLAAWTLWARGNTVIADYNAANFPVLDFATHPGVLALWRIAGVSVAVWMIHRLAQGGASRSPRVQALALVAGVGIALVALLEVPLSAWHESRLGVSKLAVGSLLSSQSDTVIFGMHALSVLAAVAAALAWSRLLRPDWFAKRVDAEPAA